MEDNIRAINLYLTAINRYFYISLIQWVGQGDTNASKGKH
jgi:hypothetical protein